MRGSPAGGANIENGEGREMPNVQLNRLGVKSSSITSEEGGKTLLIRKHQLAKLMREKNKAAGLGQNFDYIAVRETSRNRKTPRITIGRRSKKASLSCNSAL